MSSTRSRSRCVVVLVLLVAAGLAPAGAHADAGDSAAPQTWAVSPAAAGGPDGRAAFEYVVEPADTYADHVAIRNFGEQPLTVALYAQDAVQTIDDGFEVLTPDEDGGGIGEWIVLDADEITIPPRDHVVVPFTITVPPEAEPGDHAAGIVAVSAPVDGDSAVVQYRVGTRMHLRVAGPVNAALDVDRLYGHYEPRWAVFAPAVLDVEATLENTGNVRLAPHARVRVEGLFGWWSATASVDGLDELLPHGARSAVARIPETPPIGPLWVSVEVFEVRSAGQDVTDITVVTSSTTVVWAIPWVLLAVVVLLLSAGGIAVVNYRRRRRSSQESNRRIPHPLS